MTALPPLQWTSVRTLYQIHFQPEQKDHSSLLHLTSALSQHYPKVHQGQVSVPTQVQTKEGVKLQSTQVPQWILRGENLQVAITPTTITLERVGPGQDRSSTLKEASNIWALCLFHLKPESVSQVSLRHAFLLPEGTSFQDGLLPSPYVPSCLMGMKMNGVSRCEFSPRKDLRITVSVGPSQQKLPLFDVDLVSTEAMESDWQSVESELQELYQQLDPILESSLRTSEAQLTSPCC